METATYTIDAIVPRPADSLALSAGDRGVELINQQRCRLSGGALEVVLDLGRQPLGNGFLSSFDRPEFFYSLRCGFNAESRLFQLIDQPSPELMFHQDYAFFSGTSRRMAAHFESFADSVIGRGFVSDDGLVVELGSNDGILLKNFAGRGIRHLGIEPSGDVADVAESQGIRVTREFFDPDLAARILEEDGPADLVVAANVMCHIPDVRGLASGIALLLKSDGVLVFEDPYLGDVVRLGSYDQIYDEHVFLFSALSVKEIFAGVGMELIDVEPQTTHGGSMRYTLAKAGCRDRSAAVEELLSVERSEGLHLVETFRAFAARVDESGRALRLTLENLASQGQRVAAYGATSKSTTVYNYAGIGPELISLVYDNTPSKVGKLTPGRHIPVVDESRFATDPPDVAFLAAWNHEREIMDRHRAFAERGGRWLTHVPQVRFLRSP